MIYVFKKSSSLLMMREGQKGGGVFYGLLKETITEWLKELLVGWISSNLSGMFDSVNGQVADISVQVGQTPQGWNAGIFNMIQNLSETVMVPIAGAILAFVMTLELIQLITEKNNLTMWIPGCFLNGFSKLPAPSDCHQYLEYCYGCF